MLIGNLLIGKGCLGDRTGSGEGLWEIGRRRPRKEDKSFVTTHVRAAAAASGLMDFDGLPASFTQQSIEIHPVRKWPVNAVNVPLAGKVHCLSKRQSVALIVSFESHVRLMVCELIY